MKNQYFGDVNDFLKYGILRELADDPGTLHVSWMLTPSDGSTDGKFTEYLSDPDRWRSYDPALFDFLRTEVVDRNRRAVSRIESWEGLSASFFSKPVPGGLAERGKWSAEMLDAIRGQRLVFFDPDNGIEVESCPMGRKKSNKYVFWTELVETWNRGASLLVYQHFTRERRTRFLERISGEFKERLGAQRVFVLRTPRVAYFLVPQREWEVKAAHHATEIQRGWTGLIGTQEILGQGT